jgi:lipopolysaccharide transport system ATP-binding protein
MSNKAIQVKNLSKKYFINHENQSSYTSLRDVIANSFNKKNKNFQKKDSFWALSDVNFEINKGDSVGIIGRNGAGKSTLLKILSRITEPSSGRIEISGRMASLLEVGTGFHPELTGRENIYLNGAILGMTRNEIKRKFDEIVEFSGVEYFLDTPVKRFSSGMYVRLAFSVAAHLESEILIVDEVLAVGDAEFQNKCLGKMNDVANSQGRTVLFVSHNLSSIKKLCNKSVLLNKGHVELFDKTENVINKYNSIGSSESSNILINNNIKVNLQGKLGITLNQISVHYDDFKNFQINQNDSLTLDFLINNLYNNLKIRIGLFIYNESNECVLSAINDSIINSELILLENGDNNVRLKFNKHCLMPGRYRIRLWIKTIHERLLDYTSEHYFIEVNNNFFNNHPELTMGSAYSEFNFKKI